MCSVAKVASCQISFLPIQSADYITDINRVLCIIEASGLDIDLGSMSTVIRGDRDKVLKLVDDVYTAMEETCSFVMDIKLSNICGCKTY